MNIKDFELQELFSLRNIKRDEVNSLESLKMSLNREVQELEGKIARIRIASQKAEDSLIDIEKELVRKGAL